MAHPQGTDRDTTRFFSCYTYARPRHQDALDIVVLVQDADVWEKFLCAKGWTRKGALSIGRWAYTNGEHEIDILISARDWKEPAILEAQNNRYDHLPVLPLAWIVWMKLATGRTSD